MPLHLREWRFSNYEMKSKILLKTNDKIGFFLVI